MEERKSEDLWTPFKKLEELIEIAINKPHECSLPELENSLREHKQNFLTLLKNPPRNAAYREELNRGLTAGITIPDVGHQILSRELVQEAIIISDMFELNEYMALDLLCTAQLHMPNHPGLTRGLVAILLYFDGRRALVQALRMLIQARSGVLWASETSPDAVLYIMQYTDQLLADGLFDRIFELLLNLDLSKEIELLQKNRALGSPKHHREVLDTFQNIRQSLADIVFFWSAQTGLPKEQILKLIKHLQLATMQDDPTGAVDDVTLTLQMALMYALDLNVLQRLEEDDLKIQKLPLISDPTLIEFLIRELSPDKAKWNCEGLQALTSFTFGLSLATLRMTTFSIPSATDQADIFIDHAIQNKIFEFLNQKFLNNDLCFTQEFFIKRLHNLMTDFIVLMHSKVKDLRLRADETARTIQMYMQEGLEAPSNLPHYFENLLQSIAKLYSKDVLDLKLILDYWTNANMSSASRLCSRSITLFKFVRQAGELLPPTLFVPYLKMISSLASCQQAARHTFNLLKQNSSGNVTTMSWDHFFNSLNQYYSNLRLEAPPSADTVYPIRNHPRGITPLEIQGLVGVLEVIRTVADNDDFARVALCEHPGWACLNVLLGLISCPVPIQLKAELLNTLASLSKSFETAMQMWSNLEASQIVVTIPSTSSYQPRGIQTELEEIESRLEEYCLTKAFLNLINVLISSGIPRMLGAGPRKPGFDPYLTFIINTVFIKFNSRSYKNPEEKWEIAQLCLELFVKFLSQYDPQVSDFPNQRSDVNPPPGFHIMLQLSSKTELLRLVLYIIDEGARSFDTYTIFPGKKYLENAALLSLKLLDHAFQLSDKFFTLVHNVACPMMLIKLEKLLMGINQRSGRPDYLLNIIKYVTYNSWLKEHPYITIKIILAIISKPTINEHILGLITANSKTGSEILQGFVDCLEAEDVENDDEDDPNDLVNSTKLVILKLFKECMKLSPPNLCHYFFGFNLKNDVHKTVLQMPGILGFPRTCLHSLFIILNKFAKQHSKCHPAVVESAYSILYLLCSNPHTSQPMLRFIRSHHSFYDDHINALPLNVKDAVSLNQASWLLKIVAIELKISAESNHISQLIMLVKLLLGYSVNPVTTNRTDVAMITSELVDKKNVNRLILMLDNLKSNSEAFPTPRWDYFDNTLMERVLKNCEHSVGGIRLLDIKKLHRTLMEELGTLQGSAAVSQRQSILKEIENVLKYAVKYNNWKNKTAASLRFMDSWRQVAEVLFLNISLEVISLDAAQNFLIQILHSLLFLLVPTQLSTELGNIVSEATLMLFLCLRNTYKIEQKQLLIKSQDPDMSFMTLYSNTVILQRILRKIVEWIIVSEVTAQKLRMNLYSALLHFMSILTSRNSTDVDTKKAQSNLYFKRLDNTKYRISEQSRYSEAFEELSTFGEKLIDILCHDCTGGHDVCKMLAFAVMDMMVEVDRNNVWINFLSARGYLKHIIDSILESDEQLKAILDPMPENLKPLYLYESKMALLCRIGMTKYGAEIILEQKALACLSVMRVFDYHPEIHQESNILRNEFTPPIENRYQRLLFPVLNLCDSIITSLGPENQSACVQIIHFLSSHTEAIELVIRSGNPNLAANVLKELALLTGVVARTTNYDMSGFLDMGDNSTYLNRIQKLILALFPRFVITDTVIRNLSLGTGEEMYENPDRLLFTLKIACHLLLYARNCIVGHGIDHRSTGVIFPPTLNDTVTNDLRLQYSNIGDQTPSLGIIVKQLMQCVQCYHKEKLTLEFLVRKVAAVPSMNSTDLKEFIPSTSVKFNIMECRMKAHEKLSAQLVNKRKEMDYYTFLIENCVYLIWAHLDFYMLRSIPKISSHFGPNTTHSETLLASAAETSWRVTSDDIGNLKQSLVGIFNETFSRQLTSTGQVQSARKSFVEALLRRIKRLIQFVPVN